MASRNGQRDGGAEPSQHRAPVEMFAGENAHFDSLFRISGNLAPLRQRASSERAGCSQCRAPVPKIGNRARASLAAISATRGSVVALEAAAQRIYQHLLGQAADEGVAVLLAAAPSIRWASGRTGHRATNRRHPPGTCHPRPPRADRVQILEAEAQRVHLRVAGRAHRVLAMLLHLLPQRCRLADLGSSSAGTKAAAREAAHSADFPESTCRAAPATCGSNTRKSSGCWPAPESRRRAASRSYPRGGTPDRSRRGCRRSAPGAH